MKIIKRQLDIEFVKNWMNKGVNPIILSILYRRGYTSQNDLLDFFLPLFENLPSPFLFSDIISAIDRINTAINRKEKIIIFGDRDVDGTTSVSILVSFLRNKGADVSWDVPIIDEPYGLNSKKFCDWKKKSYSLCITVDCGITNVKEIKELKELKIDTIVIDHHQQLDILPDAVSIINPKTEKGIEFSDIAACGVVFLFIYGYIIYKSEIFNTNYGVFYINDKILYLEIYNNLLSINKIQINNQTNFENVKTDNLYIYNDDTNNEIINNIKKRLNIKKLVLPVNSFLNLLDDNSLKARILLFTVLTKKINGLDVICQNYLPYVMLGQIADIMPLIRTNRIFTKLGLLYLEKNQNIKELVRNVNLDPNIITSKELAWNICPILNASGRMGNAKLTVEYLLTEKINQDNIDKMIKNNNLRRQKGDEAYNLFFSEIEQNKNYYDDNLAFFYSEDIHRGITGITASKLSSKLNCPAIVAKMEGEYITGSIRGNSDLHFVEFLDKANHLLEEYGGHKQAAGFRLHKNNLDLFKAFLKLNSDKLITSDISDQIDIDAEIPIDYLNFDLFKIINFFEPTGCKNENPIFYTPSLEIYEYVKMGKEKQHIKIFFKTKNKPFTGVYWNQSVNFELIHNEGNKYNVIYQLELNKYNNQIFPQMNILYLQKSRD
jgi:single-stranded-DNA-specific exonuclease